ncbi:MAG: hypothetical protein N2Z85_01805 [Patescibacteria group bacterium]|nr:hypothetical protein [Patescibacteria group bacterium]
MRLYPFNPKKKSLNSRETFETELKNRTFAQVLGLIGGFGLGSLLKKHLKKRSKHPLLKIVPHTSAMVSTLLADYLILNNYEKNIYGKKITNFPNYLKSVSIDIITDGSRKYKNKKHYIKKNINNF